MAASETDFGIFKARTSVLTEKWFLRDIPDFVIDLGWVCTIDIQGEDRKEESFMFCFDFSHISSCRNEQVQYCVFRSKVYELHSLLPVMSTGQPAEFVCHFGADTKEFSEGCVLSFRELVRCGDAFNGLADGIDWDSRPVHLQRISTLCSQVRDKLFGIAFSLCPSIPPVSLSTALIGAVDQPLVWKCSRCGILREPAGAVGGPAKCVRRQTFRSCTAPSAGPCYSSFARRGPCAERLCGLQPGEHFRNGPALVCPRFYDCCRCLAAATDCNFDLQKAGCGPCRAVTATESGTEGNEAACWDGAGGLGPAEEDRETLRGLFNFADADGDGRIRPEDLHTALRLSGEGRSALLDLAKGALAHLELLDARRASLADVLTEALSDAAAQGSAREGAPPHVGGRSGMTFEEFVVAAGRVLRVRGERVAWAGTVGLEGELMRHLAGGTLGDGLRGLRELNGEELDAHIDSACSSFCAAVPALVRRAIRRLRAGADAVPAVRLALCAEGVDPVVAAASAVALQRDRNERGELVRAAELALRRERAAARAEAARAEAALRRERAAKNTEAERRKREQAALASERAQLDAQGRAALLALRRELSAARAEMQREAEAVVLEMRQASVRVQSAALTWEVVGQASAEAAQQEAEGRRAREEAAARAREARAAKDDAEKERAACRAAEEALVLQLYEVRKEGLAIAKAREEAVRVCKEGEAERGRVVARTRRAAAEVSQVAAAVEGLEREVAAAEAERAAITAQLVARQKDSEQLSAAAAATEQECAAIERERIAAVQRAGDAWAAVDESRRSAAEAVREWERLTILEQLREARSAVMDLMMEMAETLALADQNVAVALAAAEAAEERRFKEEEELRRLTAEWASLRRECDALEHAREEAEARRTEAENLRAAAQAELDALAATLTDAEACVGPFPHGVNSGPAVGVSSGSALDSYGTICTWVGVAQVPSMLHG